MPSPHSRAARPPASRFAALVCVVAVCATAFSLGCNRTRASREARSAAAQRVLAPAPPPDGARPIRVEPIRCATYDGRVTAALEQALAARRDEARGCFRGATGALVLDLAVAEDGDVLGATVRLRHEALDGVGACASDVLRAVRLPPPEGGCVRVALALDAASPPTVPAAAPPATPLPSAAPVW